LASSIPNLGFDDHFIDDEGFDGELYTDGGFGIIPEYILGKFSEKVCLANA
jgi:hypothetical protein